MLRMYFNNNRFNATLTLTCKLVYADYSFSLLHSVRSTNYTDRAVNKSFRYLSIYTVVVAWNARTIISWVVRNLNMIEEFCIYNDTAKIVMQKRRHQPLTFLLRDVWFENCWHIMEGLRYNINTTATARIRHAIAEHGPRKLRRKFESFWWVSIIKTSLSTCTILIMNLNVKFSRLSLSTRGVKN